jgi:hypothetical protein
MPINKYAVASNKVLPNPPTNGVDGNKFLTFVKRFDLIFFVFDKN